MFLLRMKIQRKRHNCKYNWKLNNHVRHATILLSPDENLLTII
jgi:hypothetical protein